jgi:hypothetical protein
MMQLSTKVRHSLPRANFDDRSVVSNKSFGSTVVDLERAICRPDQLRPSRAALQRQTKYQPEVVARPRLT